MKRRRFGRNVGRAKKSVYSSNTAWAAGLVFKRRRFNPRLATRQAFIATNYATKYRSYNTITTTFSPPTVANSMTTGVNAALATNYMLTAGGLQAPYTVTAIDNWSPSLFIRGGKLRFSISNNATTLTGANTSVRVKIWLAWSRKVVPSAVTTTFGTTSRSPLWDPTDIYTWQQYIKVPKLMTEKILIGADAVVVECKLPAFRDQVAQQAVSGLYAYPYWIYAVESMNANTTAACTVVSGYNLSFCGDLNGVTGY